MNYRKYIIIAVGLLLCIGSAAGAQSASELLEQGIYEEETAGDLEAAIKIYNQIIKDAEVDRPSIAQALYRLGMCHLKSGQDDAAVRTFEKLVGEFPEQEDLVEKARQHLPEASKDFVLGPVPWVDDEVLIHTAKLPGGLEIGRFIWIANSITLAGKEGWRLRLLRYIGDGSNQGSSRVDVWRDNLAPISSTFNHTQLGEIEVAYAADKVKMTTKGEKEDAVHEIDIDRSVYDNEEAGHLMRRLPLEVGYKTTLPIFIVFQRQVIDIGLEVTVRETIEVPAGTFECYKIELSIQQTLWISTGPERYMVKFEGGGATTELTQIGTRKMDEPTAYEDEDWDFSLSAPPGWYISCLD
jgi:hypothetical protein